MSKNQGDPSADIATEQLRHLTDGITKEIADRLPLQQPAGERWPAVAHGFLARGGTLLESVTRSVEAGMPGEAQMLIRILIEHVMTFCWIGIAPEAHVRRWREWADYRQLQVHKYAKELFKIEPMSPDQVTRTEAAQRPLKLHKMASEVDSHWSKVSPAFRPYDPAHPDILTFIGVYTAVYSKTSNLVHADVTSVERFWTMPLLGQITVHDREKRSESNDYPSIALAMIGFLLVAFEHHFRWPDRELIDAMTAGLMPRD